MITDTEQCVHAANHVSHAARHIECAQEHLANAAKAYLAKGAGSVLRKMSGASMTKAAYEMGRSAEQVGMAAKHMNSLIGRPGWDGTSDFDNANKALNDVNHHLGLAHDRHCELAEAVKDGDSAAIKDGHDAVSGHLGQALSSAKTASSVIEAALRERNADVENGPEKPAGAANKQDGAPPSQGTDAFTSGQGGNHLDGYNLEGQHDDDKKKKKKPVTKGYLTRALPPAQEEELLAAVTDPIIKAELAKTLQHWGRTHLEFFIPIRKVQAFKADDGTESLMVEGYASVADFVDGQNDVPLEDALRKAMEDWAVFGNIRLQHDPSKPVGTIKYPTIGALPSGTPLPGWWMEQHPETGTMAACIRVHVPSTETEAISKIRNGLITGFSVGGSVTGEKSAVVEVDDRGVVQGIYEQAAAA
jgi:hypothetical protein